MDHRLRQTASHWRASRSPHASCPYSGAERRELPAQAIEGKAAVCDPTRRRGRLGGRSQNRRNHHRFLKPRPPRLRNPGHLRRGGRGTSNSTPSRKLAWFCSGPLAGFYFGVDNQAAPLQNWTLPEPVQHLRRLLEARMGNRGKREFIQVLRLIEVFPETLVAAAAPDAARLRAFRLRG